MADRPTAIVVSPEVPYPVAGGGALRTASIVEYLTSRYTLDVIVFRQPGAPDPAATRLAEIARHVEVLDLPYHRRDALARAQRNLGRLLRGVPPLTDRFSGFDARVAGYLEGRRWDVALIEHFWCAGYGPLLARHAGRTILDLHNIESVLHERCAVSERWPRSLLHRRFAAACRRLEERCLPAFTDLLVTSEDDARRVGAIARTGSVAVYPNTIPYRELPAHADEEVIAFSGNMEYHPNTTAVRFFRRQVWPLLRERFPALRWRLIGKNPEAVRHLVAGDARIECTGPVDDAIDELARVRVAVVPLLAGSGTRFKILEAWAAGTAIVSTTLGAEGLPAADGDHLLVADTAEGFADAIGRLLGSPSLRQTVAAAGRAVYESQFTWPAGWKKLERLGF